MRSLLKAIARGEKLLDYSNIEDEAIVEELKQATAEALKQA
ncbi:MAG: hypothetical protein QXV97_06640 [Candidatus Caldarchaeum sp.]